MLLEFSDTKPNVAHLEHFINNNKRITRLSLFSNVDLASVLPTIAKSLKYLKTLHLSNFGSRFLHPTRNLQNLRCCGYLESLQHLTLFFNSLNASSFIKAVAAFGSMNRLQLFFGTVDVDDQLIEQIIKFKNLEKLYLFGMDGWSERHIGPLGQLNALKVLNISSYNLRNPLTSCGIIQLIQKLEKLAELSIFMPHGGFVWDQQTYDRIVEIRRNRPVRVQLKLRFSRFCGIDAIRQDPEHREYVELNDVH